MWRLQCFWAQQWFKDRSVQLQAGPSKTNCADLGTEVHSADSFNELLRHIGLKDNEDVEKEAIREALPVAVIGAGGTSPLAGIIAFLSSLLAQAETNTCNTEHVVDEAAAAFEIAGGTSLHWTKIALLAAVVVVVAGMLVCIYLSLVVARMIAAHSADNSAPTLRAHTAPASTMPARTRTTRSVETMSQVTYRWELQRPRLQPLAEREHGA